MPTYQSRWGFHPCDFQGFKKLKRLHAAYYKGLRLIAKHKRWERKEPQNRKAEPVVPAVYRSLVNSDIVYRYHLARVGVAGPEGVDGISGSYWEVVESWIAGLDEVHVTY
jgi:hypothetical protein